MWIHSLIFVFSYLVIVSAEETTPGGTTELGTPETSMRNPTEINSSMPGVILNDSLTDGTVYEEARRQSTECIFFPNLGCFEMESPWSSKERPLEIPNDPEEIKTTIQLYTRLNSVFPTYVQLYPTIAMKNSKFDAVKKSVVIVHGFASSGNDTWVKKMKDVYLRKVDANVMVLDWGCGAQHLYYAKAVANTRIVGKQFSQFVKYLIQNFEADPNEFHLIGHGLGAHVCSYLAKSIRGMGRLTALDPAQAYFEGFDKRVRLDRTDANFVDVIHTDSLPFIPTLGFGMIKPHGDVDFYINGGYNQPKCTSLMKRRFILKALLQLGKYIVKALKDIVSCSHMRAYEYFIESIDTTNNCTFLGLRANTLDLFKPSKGSIPEALPGKLTPLSSYCYKENCVPLGLDTEKSPVRGVFVVITKENPPYCIQPISEPDDMYD